MVLGWLTLSVECLFAGGVPGEQWAATVFCRHCRSPEPLVCHWVAPGECLIGGNADPAAFARTYTSGVKLNNCAGSFHVGDKDGRGDNTATAIGAACNRI